METKQHATEQPMVQSNQKRNRKLPWDIWKWKIQPTKTQDAANAVLRGKVSVGNASLRKQERSQTA